IALGAAGIRHDEFAVVAFAQSLDGKHVAISDLHGMVRVWELATSKVIFRASLPPKRGYAESLAFAPEGQALAAACPNGRVLLWSLAQAEPNEARVLATYNEAAQAVAFAPDGKTAAWSVGEKIVLWDRATSKPLHELAGHERTVLSLAFSA